MRYVPGIRGRVIGLAVLPMAIVGVLLFFQMITSKIEDLDESLRTRAVAIVRQLGPATEYGVASGNVEVLRTLLEKAAIEPDIRGVAVLASDGRMMVQAGLGNWNGAAHAGLPTTRIQQIEYKEHLVYYAPIIRTEVAVDDYQAQDAPGGGASESPQLLGWVALDVSRSATLRSQREAILHSLAILLAGLVASLYLAWRIGRQITRPILALMHASAVSARGISTSGSPRTARPNWACCSAVSTTWPRTWRRCMARCRKKSTWPPRGWSIRRATTRSPDSSTGASSNCVSNARCRPRCSRGANMCCATWISISSRSSTIPAAMPRATSCCASWHCS